MGNAADRESICREHLQRVIDSPTFHGSSASRKLLSYLGERTLAEQVDDLKEYTIGVEALGRPTEYDPQIDPSVRVQVSRLRKRLGDYYDREGSADAFKIELPKRQFALRFVDPAAAADSEKGQLPPPPEMFWRRTSVALAIILALALGALLHSGGPSSATLSAAAAESAFTPEMREFWQPYLESDLPVKLSLGIALFVRIPGGGGTSTTYVRQAQINDWPPAGPTPSLDLLRSALGSTAELNAAYTYSRAGEAIGAYLLGKHLERAGLDVPIVRSSVLSWDAASNSNMIFVGPPKYNRQIETGSFERNFRVVPDGVQNLNPVGNELPFYGEETTDVDRPKMAHAVISRYKSAAGPGIVTIFASNDGTGTWGSVEQVTRNALLADLLKALRREDGSIPESFEAVVRTRCDLDYPVEVSYVTHREY